MGDLKIKKLMNEVDLHDLEKILADIAKMSRGKSLILKDKVLQRLGATFNRTKRFVIIEN
ncbi:MAG: hypothetical protein ACKVOU_03805 [Cytophagales bacterium]